MKSARWLPYLVVAGLSILCFLPALDNEFVFDDIHNFVTITEYRELSPRSLGWMLTWHKGNWQPLTWFSHAVEYQLWGNSPWHFHLDNLLLHGINGALCYGLLLLLLRRVQPEAPGLELAAMIGALFWAVHPLRVESVAWATERRDLLSGGFLMAAVICYLRRADGGGPGWLVGSLLCYALSLLSKAWGVTLPAVLILLDLYPLRRVPGLETRRVLTEKLSYVLLSVPAIVMAPLAQQGVQAMRGWSDHGPLQRLLQACWGLCFYLYKTVWPRDLSALYELEPSLDVTDPIYLGSAAVVLGLTALLVARRRRWPALLAVWVCYAVIASPVLGLFQSGAHKAADRYTYIACIPLSLLLSGGLLTIGRRRGLLVGLLLGLVALLGTLTWRQTEVWHDSIRLWAHAVRVTPEGARVHFFLGRSYDRVGRLEEAVAAYEKALALQPALPEALMNLGTVYHRLGRLTEADALYARAVALQPEDAQPHRHRGALRAAQGRLPEALADYERACELAPDYWEVWLERGKLLLRMKRPEQARRALLRAAELAPPEQARRIREWLGPSGR